MELCGRRRSRDEKPGKLFKEEIEYQGQDGLRTDIVAAVAAVFLCSRLPAYTQSYCPSSYGQRWHGPEVNP
jgi:hypothetical protein